MPMRLGSPMPPLEGETGRYNAEGFDPAQLKGSPVLVHFWSVSCHICHEVMDQVSRFRDEYQPKGLKVVAIHMPKEEGDLDTAKVERDMAQYGITQPVLLDHQHRLAQAFQNQFVPAFFLFDAQGNLFFRAAGDKGLQNLGPKLEQLFA
ncbi:thiol-disulfide isomerase/thioredoxin [Symbiobacterium terraclitae]|uniref:Thiol-disulfide isomerase/thioredoxin n=1 Tax=Symbiobacterium terraclitae TaxID=557451 RepID=A0ABS4JVI1_9FIRM|nr:TlpA disulfide reductase family protein [Symbiobacterium terraclitae]MBP2019559.1 thiol-disulfide isomerase/thioredoxin [Symbiobacterium terraclitae]